MELLFETRSSIKRLVGRIYPKQEKAEIISEPIFVGDTLTDGGGIILYGTIIHDKGIYRMWYQSYPKEPGGYKGCDSSLVGYAESDNGIDWRKPTLNIQSFNGSKENNLCNLGFHSPTIFIDPKAESSFRYRATGFASLTKALPNPKAKGSGYYTAHSADGLNWILDSDKPQWMGRDVITSIYHPKQERGIVALKYKRRVNDIPRRAIYTAEYKDGIWSSETSSALIPDDYDDICAKRSGHISADYYGMGMMPSGTGIVGFLWNFKHALPLTEDIGGVFGSVDIGLVFQEKPGDIWLHQPGRPDFINNNSIKWGNSIYTASSPIDIGDETYLYFSACTEHGLTLDEKWNRIDEVVNLVHEEKLGNKVGIAKWKKNRLFGFEGLPKGIIDIDLGTMKKAFEVKMNLKTESYGSVLAQLIDDKENVVDSAVLTGDIIDKKIVWERSRSCTIEALSDSVLTLRLMLSFATVYAYECNTIV